jgi:hypothetical protein
MKLVLAALALSLLAACATPVVTAQHDAPHPSDTCVLLSVARQGSTETRLDAAQQQRVRAIHTSDLERPAQHCGDASYPTDPNQLGLTFLSIGFSGDRHFAALKLQSVAGPLAAAGYTCLYEAADESWTLRGCDMDWIS